MGREGRRSKKIFFLKGSSVASKSEGRHTRRTRRRPSFNCSLSDLLFPFFAALSREGLGFGFPPRRIGGQHLLGRPTHGWVHADDETLLGEHSFFRYRPDFL